MGVSGGRPDVVKARQGEVDRGDRGGEMPDRSDAADGEAGVLSHEVGIRCPPEASTRTGRRSPLSVVPTKIRELAISAGVTSSACAAASAVRTASGRWRTSGSRP